MGIKNSGVDDPVERVNESQSLEVVIDTVTDEDRLASNEGRQRCLNSRQIQHGLCRKLVGRGDAGEASIAVENRARRPDELIEYWRVILGCNDGDTSEAETGGRVDELAVESENGQTWCRGKCTDEGSSSVQGERRSVGKDMRTDGTGREGATARKDASRRASTAAFASLSSPVISAGVLTRLCDPWGIVGQGVCKNAHRSDSP